MGKIAEGGNQLNEEDETVFYLSQVRKELELGRGCILKTI